MEARRAHNPKVAGSSPAPANYTEASFISSFFFLPKYGGLAQLVEQRNHNPQVTGSSPVAAIVLIYLNYRNSKIRKKLLYSCLIAVIFGGFFSFFYIINSFTSSLNTNTPCAFCDHQIVNRQKFYEDDLVVALCTHKPIVPSHFLVIPKRHVERLEMLSKEEISRIHQVITKVNQASKQLFQTSSYFIHQKNGQEVGQSVPHVHFHFIAKSAGDSSHLKFLINMIIANLKSPISLQEQQNVTKKMKAFMESAIINSQ